ncbi:MAG: PFL family protein [Prevotella sp.]|nr:PFL family protein [Prevotella sp.]
MINISEVLETNKMIEQENLDVRTITMGINLLDCADKSLDVTCEKIYSKITSLARNLVSTGEEISREFAIPIVNKRISITPISLVGSACCKIPADYVQIAKTLDKAAKEVGVNFLGGYSAIVSKGMTKSDELLIRSIPQALAETERICSSINVGSTKTGINMDAVRLMGEIIKQTAEYTKEQDSLGCAKLVVLCNAPDDNPFMAGAFHGVSEADAIINVGVSGPGVVKYALEQMDKDCLANFETLSETIKKTAFKITRVGQLVAQEASKRLGIPFGIIDLSLAPTPAIGDSVADILQCMGVERAGAPGTTACLAMLNDQVKKGGVMASSYVGGLSGAFIPVSEDQGMIDSVVAGALTIEKLEAMTCVCSVGLDMIAIPGDTTAATISGIIADESAIGMVNQKTTAVRIIPVIGKKVGDTVEFGGLLGYAPIMPVNTFGCERFVNRGGRIPAPIHSFKN